ncbi:hypothetical protein ACFCX4_35835 [Kitasatospora sp. NPDC056327]|uniref:hypothetical protein n=1 Tax=Kitasatospora sp. NPDC056327 TaxID=3345785 RepID=UPI0035E10C95
MRSIPKVLVAGAVAGAVALTGVAVAQAATGAPAGSAAVTADDTPPPAVEDFTYPGADKIFTDRGIKLISGDGHMVLVTCPTPGNALGAGVLKVEARNMTDRDPIGGGKFCFQITGNSASIKLELPAVYGITTPDYAVTARMVTGTGAQTEEKVYTLTRSFPNAVGEAGDPSRRPFTLLDIYATK